MSGTTQSAGHAVNVRNEDGLSINYVPPQTTLQKTGQFLSPAKAGASLKIAQDFLTAHAGDLGLLPGDLSSAIVTDQYTDADSGVTHIYLRQVYNGLPVINGNLGVNVARDGRIINVNSSFVSGLSAKQNANNLPDAS